MADTQHKPHALIIAYPLQGHIIPSVHLAIKLASKGFTITFVNTQAIHHHTCKAQPGCGDDVFAASRDSGLDIRYEIISDGLPVEFDRSLNHDQFMYSLLHVFSAHVEELVGKLRRNGPPITCMIADTFFVWPSTMAKKLDLIYVSFWTEPALVFTLYYHMDLLRRNGHFASNDIREDTINYIPGVPSIEPMDLMSYLQETEDLSTVVHQIIFKAFEEAKGAEFVLCNTVQELEPETISALKLEKPFYAIGPIFPTGFTKSVVPTSLWSESDCGHWLDSKPRGSVLYISFGSYAHVSKRDIEEIGFGILNSNVSFIWVLRPDIVCSTTTTTSSSSSSTDNSVPPLPTGFLQVSKERGIVVPWCCQISVLSHHSIGGFLTHCGWNSIMESIWCEVPMLCFPLLTDQFTNRKLVVDDWRIGMEIGGIRKPPVRDKVSEKIIALMSGKLGKELRKEIKQVRSALEFASTVDGSSEKNLNCFIEDLNNKFCCKNKRLSSF